jgi:hypothetical protein
LFAAFAIGWLAIAPVGAQADTISVGSFPLNLVPSYLPTPPSGTFYVPVEISGAVSLQNWQFSLTFDNTVVQEVDPLDGRSGIYGAEFTPGDPNSQSFILSGFPFNIFGVVDTVAGSYPSLLNGPSGDGVLADILFEFLPGQENNNPHFSITGAVVLAPVPAPEAGSLGLFAGLALLAGFFAVHRVKEDLMKKSLLAAASAITIVASGSVGAQTVLNGPYYANPSWDQQLPAAQRFIVLSNWNNVAVLDRETGLVWQRSPDSSVQHDSWSNASVICHNLGLSSGFVDTIPTGGRAGWRLPSIEELASLVDRTQSNPALPAGHPFQGIQNAFYWAATTEEDDNAFAYMINMGTGLHGFARKEGPGGPDFFNYWCVRGGAGMFSPPLPPP